MSSEGRTLKMRTRKNGPKKGSRKIKYIDRVPIGDNHQANLPKCAMQAERQHKAAREAHRAVKLYSHSSCTVPDEDLRTFVAYAKHFYSYNEEQTLGVLWEKKFNYLKAMKAMEVWLALPNQDEDWTDEEKEKFKEAFKKMKEPGISGNNFLKLKEELPDKDMGSILYFYYTKFFSYKESQRCVKINNKK